MDRSAELQAICLRKDWVDKLAERWVVCPGTIRAWARLGHFGPIYRHGMGFISVGSQAVFDFESKYADALGVGVDTLDAIQLRKRYGIAKRTFTSWKSLYGFPSPAKVPGTIIRRWRLREVEQWEFSMKITPKTTIAKCSL